jgi:hypothetical protein
MFLQRQRVTGEHFPAAAICDRRIVELNPIAKKSSCSSGRSVLP